MLCRFSQGRPSRMSHHPYGVRKARGGLLDALSRIVKARRGAKGFVYHRIRPTMTSDTDDVCDLSDVILQENSDAETQVTLGRRRTREIVSCCLTFSIVFTVFGRIKRLVLTGILELLEISQMGPRCKPEVFLWKI